MYEIGECEQIRLDPHVEKIKEEILKRSTWKGKCYNPLKVFAYLRYLAMHLAKDSALEVVWRYKKRREVCDLVVDDVDSLFMRISRGLVSKFNLEEVEGSRKILFSVWYAAEVCQKPYNVGDLDALIYSLAYKISLAAEKYEHAGAWKRFAGYVLTRLGVELSQSAWGENFDKSKLRFLAFFWKSLAQDFYETETRRGVL